MTAALKALKEDTETKATVLSAKIAQAQDLADRYRRKLARLYEESEQRAAEVSRSYLSIPAPSNEGEPAVDGAPRTRRWSLDVPVLKMIRAMNTPVVAVPEVWARWNQDHPDRPVGRSTIRGVLERLVRDRSLVPLEDGAQRGRTNVRAYMVSNAVMDQQEEEGVIAH